MNAQPGRRRKRRMQASGSFDEAQPKTVAHYQSLLPGSGLVVFEDSSHTAHLEERERYIQVIRDFLHRVEGIP